MTAAHGAILRAIARRQLPPPLARGVVVLAPGAERATTAAEWSGALVLVDAGTLEVECASGSCERFARGALLALGWLPVRTIRNPGPVPLRLVAVRRRSADDAVGSQ